MESMYGIVFKHLIGLESFCTSGVRYYIAGSFGYLGFTEQTCFLPSAQNGNKGIENACGCALPLTTFGS